MNFKYILIIVVLIAIIGGGFLVWQLYWQPKEESGVPETATQTGNEVANWKTYQNKEYNFSIDYPKSWYAYEDTLGHIVISTFSKDKYDKYYGTYEHTKLGENSGVILLSYQYSKTGSMEGWLASAKRSTERFCQVGIKCEETVIKEIKVTDQKGYRIYMPYSESQTMYEKGIRLTYIFLNRSGEGYSIFSGDFAGKDKTIYEQYAQDFDQMILTFRFPE